MEINDVICPVCNKAVGYTPGKADQYFEACPYYGKKQKTPCDD